MYNFLVFITNKWLVLLHWIIFSLYFEWKRYHNFWTKFEISAVVVQAVSESLSSADWSVIFAGRLFSAKFCWWINSFQTKKQKYNLKGTEFHRDLYYLLILNQRYNQIPIFLELYFFTKSISKVTSADKKYTFQETKIDLISYILCSLNEQFNFAFCNSNPGLF